MAPRSWLLQLLVLLAGSLSARAARPPSTTRSQSQPDRPPEQRISDELAQTVAEFESRKYGALDVGTATEDDLKGYQLYLERRLDEVRQALGHANSGPKLKRFIPLPVSASLPDRGSRFFTGRSTAIAKQVDESESEPTTVVDERITETEAPTEGSVQVNETASTTPDNVGTPVESVVTVNASATENPVNGTDNSAHVHHPKAFSSPTVHFAHSNAQQFNPTRNHTLDECKRLSQSELVKELKQKGTYNPDLMAWDASGVFRFLDRSIVDQYERQVKAQTSSQQAVQRNVLALERILAELNLQCDIRSPEVLSKISNLTILEPRRSIMSPSLRLNDEEISRFKRHDVAEDLLRSFNNSRSRDQPEESETKRQKMIGEVHVVPFGCDKRGEREDGYLRLCGACQAIRKLPDSFFPPFINEVMCDEDKACLYFYDYPHGKCKQKHMNFVVLRNVGTPQCQIWQKFNLNVRVSCECFVDEMSFFSKYV